MSDMSDRPSTSSAVPLTLRPAQHAAPSQALALRRDGLTYQALQTSTCPACGLRPPSAEPHRFTLRGKSRLVEAVERVFSPPTMLLAGMLSGFVLDNMWWPLLVVFGPSAAASNASMARLLWSPRYRLKVSLCPSCANTIRQARIQTRKARGLKHFGAWTMVMLAPAVLTNGLTGPFSTTVTALLAGTAGLLSCVGHWLERDRKTKADAMLPALESVTAENAQLLPPETWMPVLSEQSSTLLLPPVGGSPT
jgi:hypothetical protein